MCSPEILKLAEIVEENEREIIEGSSKLILSADLLIQLNNCFCLLRDHPAVKNTSFHKDKTNKKDFSQLEYLHDFIEKTISLKLTPTQEKQHTDITLFKNLRFLEINKLNINMIVGIETLRNKLQNLACFRSLDNLRDVLEKCGGDGSIGRSWSELKIATFSHNSLKQVDASLEFAQNLNMLNISHNEISEVKHLNCLVNLKYLNLGYNKLINVPNFYGHICNRLRVLILRNNFIEDINEISNLGNLNELDLQENCLIEHNCLIPLAELAALQWINLSGNPLSYHPQHRNKTSSCFHVSTISVVLDGQVLSKTEQRLVGSLHPRIKHSPPVRQNSLEVSIQKQSRKVRDADIQSVDNPVIYELPASFSTSQSYSKKQIKKWLENQGSSVGSVPDTLSAEQNPVHSTPFGSADKIIMDELQPEKEFLIAEECSKLEVTAEVYVTASEITEQENSLYETTKVESVVEEEEVISEDDLGDGDESLFVAMIKEEVDPLIIVITETQIFERKFDNVKRMFWGIDTLMSSQINGCEVHINFDTYKTYKKQRTYVLDDEEEAQRFNEALQEIIKNKLNVVQFTAMSCMKCSYKFKIKKNLFVEKQECPSCNSAVCIVDDE